MRDLWLSARDQRCGSIGSGGIGQAYSSSACREVRRLLILTLRSFAPCTTPDVSLCGSV